MPGTYRAAWLFLLSRAFFCVVGAPNKLSVFAMAETATSPTEQPFLGEEQRQERQEQCGRCILQDDKSFR